jgi:putative nucleotidyltransferase with HDIG domain
MPANITTLVFDGGNTLIRDEGSYSGSMADWPELFAIEGVHAALESLSGTYRMVIATNAQDSGTPKIHQANQRVGIDGYFDRIYTAREMGISKPEKSYFQAIAADLGADPAELLMIGDGYTNDILGAIVAGWRAVWFNPRHEPCTSLTPLHSAEIDHMASLPEAIAKLGLPTVDQCLFWLRQRDASFNLIQHVQAVAASAYQMALWLRASGQSVDPILTHRGGLLHDLGKIKSLRGQSGGLNHGEYGAQLLNELGFPELAEITVRHMLFTIHDSAQAPHTMEEKLVYFCDKIVEGARIVPLAERIEKLSQRYTQNAAKIQSCLPALQEMQAELCRAMNVPDEKLTSRLAKSLLEN